MRKLFANFRSKTTSKSLDDVIIAAVEDHTDSKKAGKLEENDHNVARRKSATRAAQLSQLHRSEPSTEGLLQELDVLLETATHGAEKSQSSGAPTHSCLKQTTRPGPVRRKSVSFDPQVKIRFGTPPEEPNTGPDMKSKDGSSLNRHKEIIAELNCNSPKPNKRRNRRLVRTNSDISMVLQFFQELSQPLPTPRMDLQPWVHECTVSGRDMLSYCQTEVEIEPQELTHHLRRFVMAVRGGLQYVTNPAILASIQEALHQCLAAVVRMLQHHTGSRTQTMENISAELQDSLTRIMSPIRDHFVLNSPPKIRRYPTISLVAPSKSMTIPLPCNIPENVEGCKDAEAKNAIKKVSSLAVANKPVSGKMSAQQLLNSSQNILTHIQRLVTRNPFPYATLAAYITNLVHNVEHSRELPCFDQNRQKLLASVQIFLSRSIQFMEEVAAHNHDSSQVAETAQEFLQLLTDVVDHFAC